MPERCGISGCCGVGKLNSRNGKRYFHEGLCEAHRKRLIRHGDPLLGAAAKDGRSQHALYKTWVKMKERCYNPNAWQYKYYGGLGVRVSEEWRVSFKQFILDMGDKPTGTTLDRINPYGDYSKSNCRWADKYTQRNNRRNNYEEPS